ncbi:nucleotidyltransferase domain-containing protein [Kineosporia mesophila]|uniref:Nucleotidyltransferase domain-containing protein n=1 Tax=Kineosporia mesophila TaxID=566012 RepID=A0ABP7A2D6_9ACTN|nr:nucleotidyltransferase domain-containing protein [Kineosporia mesophila]MCD5348990.1 nucleotidyltransferase domain-containing protein [Kineosporia mesophila]
MSDDAFVYRIADQLVVLPGVEAVTLGGSRAQGTARPDSDWDLGIYYRGRFDPQGLRDIGWEGEASEVGGWGGGVFNGGVWLRIEGRRVDIHYRELEVVEAQLARAQRGEFDIEPLMFHLAGIPTYLVVAELAINKVLRGSLPEVAVYPEALRHAARGTWCSRADMHLDYAENNHAAQGRTVQALGLIAVALTEYAHAIAASKGQWVTNEKRILADLHEVDRLVEEGGDPAGLIQAVRALSAIQEIKAQQRP